MNTLFKLSTLGLALASTAYAAETIPTYIGNEIVVTATRTPKPVREQLNDISVITQDEIEQAGAITLAELLRSQPGIEFTSNGGMGTTSSVYIRGTNPNHALVLVDGMRINSATNGTTALEKIPLAQIERIEILRGPGSHLYGSEAIGGVIQLFTRSGKEAPAFNASAGIGSENLYSLNAGAQGKTGETHLNLQVDHLSTNGFSALANPSNPRYNPDDDGHHRTSLTGRIAHAIGVDDEIGATAFYSKNATQYDGSTTKTFDSRNEQTLSAYSLYSRNRFLPDWQSLLRLGSSMDNYLTAETDGTWSQIRTDQDQLLWQNDIGTRLGLVTLGMERVEQHVASNTAYSLKDRTIQSYFAGYQGRLEAHSVQINLRNDRNSQYGSHTTRSLAYGYQINPSWRAAASIGTAFRAPSFNDLYWPANTYGAGNPNLQPEESRNQEISVHYEQNGQLASLTRFVNHIDNLIEWAETAPYFYQPSNVNKARISGTTLSYAGKLGQHRVHASATWLDPRDSGSGLLLNRRAKKTGTLGIGHDLGKWTMGSEISASSMRFDDTANTKKMGGYALLNLSANYAYNKDVNFLLRLNNALDKQYELVSDYSTPGRNVFFSVNYQPR